MAAIARRLESQFRLPRPAIPVLVPPLPPVESAASVAVERLRKGLEARISSNLTSGTELVRALERRRRNAVVPTTIEAIDALLDGGLPRGKMTEIAGCGARFSIAVAALASATVTGEAAALVDLGNGFDPQLGADAGIDLQRMLWVRPHKLRQAVAAAEMLVATGFQLVVLDTGVKAGRVPDAAWVRLARAAEAHGSALLISSPYPITGTASVAMLRAEASRGIWRAGLLVGVQTSLRVEKTRRKRPGQQARTAFRLAESR